MSNSLRDNDDVRREIRCLFVRTNIYCCYVLENVPSPLNYPCLKPTVCASMNYDIGLWSKYSVTVFKRIEACYNKCIKSFYRAKQLC